MRSSDVERAHSYIVYRNISGIIIKGRLLFLVKRFETLA